MVLVKNWKFGASGTIRNYADMNANFYYHDQFGTINNGGKYGSNIVAPDADNAIGGQPLEGINSPLVRAFTEDSLKTFVTALDKTTTVQVRNHNAGNGSFMAKWRLPNGGSLLGRDIVWETRVRYVTPPYFWFAIWTAGNKWKWDGKAGQGAEHDLMESFGYDNGNGNTNYDGRFFHSNSVAEPRKDEWNFWDWEGTMKARGITNFDPTSYHIWTWVYRKDNSFAMYCDGVLIQRGKDYWWTFGNKKDDEPIDMDFLFDAGWGHNQIGSVNKEVPATAFEGKFFEWDYSRVYLSGGMGTPRKTNILPGVVDASVWNEGAEGVAWKREGVGSGWRNYTVQVPKGGSYQFSFMVSTPVGGRTFHVEDEHGTNLTGTLVAPTGGRQSALAPPPITIKAPKPITLSAGAHVLKLVYDERNCPITRIIVTRAPGATTTFITTDLKTQGAWKGVYGKDGYMIAGDATKQPASGTVSRTGWEVKWNGNGLTLDVRAPQKQDGGPSDRIAGQWGTNDRSYDIDCKFSDDAEHQVALYGLDWDRNGRSENIEVLDAATNTVLDTQDLNAYTNGKYLVWNVSGHVIFRVVNTSRWTNPALSAIFFDSVPAIKPENNTI